MPSDAHEPVRAPGARIAGTRRGSPSSLLLMLFGDYWLEPDAGLPSAALVTLLADFGVNDAAARAALSRMVKRGLLASSKSGRNTYYRATPRAHQILLAASRRIAEFGGPGEEWSGVWSVVAFEIPENSRALRVAARNRLEWLGFAPLYDEVWICPHDRHESAVRELESLGVEATPLQATLAESIVPTRLPQNAWDLADLARDYNDLTARMAASRDLLDRDALSPVEALVQRTRLLEAWLDLSSHDPDLPGVLLPPDWPRAGARALFLDTHQALGELATARVRATLSETDADLASLVERREIADWFRETEGVDIER